SSSDLTADQQAALDAHNAARKVVGQVAQVWDETLANNAQEWATHLISVGSLTHSEGSGQGENLYMQSATDSPFANADKMWIEEKSSYNGEAIGEGDFSSYGHYSEFLFKSTKVGMAVASGNGGTYVVARYSPAGN
ncbi:CAP domain-containing protein, partial [Ilyonectria robusta]|uniref:CAP domain-containing protein n=1 Tax=Ilyonectria robusta TaxID=1079257 RepID=UPI001E8D91C8